MPYVGTLDSTQTFRFETNSNIPGTGAVTVFWLKPGGIISVESLPGTNPTQDVAIPRRTSRISFEVIPRSTFGGSILFKLSQGTLAVEDTVLVDSIYVFDVE